MNNKKMQEYVDGLNTLYKKYGILIESDTTIYKINEPNSENEIIGILKWDNLNKFYYYLVQ